MKRKFLLIICLPILILLFVGCIKHVEPPKFKTDISDIKVDPKAPEWLKYYEIGLGLTKNQHYDDAILAFKASMLAKEGSEKDTEDTYNAEVGQDYVRYFPNRELGIVYYQKAQSGNKKENLKTAKRYLKKSLNYRDGTKSSASKTTIAVYYSNKTQHELEPLITEHERYLMMIEK